MQNGQISNQSITASSHHLNYPPWGGRLNSGMAKSWYAVAEDANPWIQVDLGRLTWLRGVATQGKMFTLFVKTYKLVYSSDEVTWFVYREPDTKVDKVMSSTSPICTLLVYPSPLDTPCSTTQKYKNTSLLMTAVCVIFFIEQIFKGNTDPYKAVKVELLKPVYTRYVRLYPQSWEDGVALKLELFGCRPE